MCVSCFESLVLFLFSILSHFAPSINSGDEDRFVI